MFVVGGGWEANIGLIEIERAKKKRKKFQGIILYVRTVESMKDPKACVRPGIP